MPDDLDRARAHQAQQEQAAAAEQQKIERLEAQKNAPGRNASASRHYQPDELSRARSAKEEFSRAAAGEQKNIDRLQQPTTPERQAESPGREASASRYYSPDHLSRARAIKEMFNRGADGHEKEAEPKARDAAEAPDKVRHAPTPGMHLQPRDPALRDGPNRDTFERNERELYLSKGGRPPGLEQHLGQGKPKDHDKDRERD
jgi:hypothetical protein